MVHEDAESLDTLSSPRRRISSSSSTMSATQEDVLMDLETKRFEKRAATTPQRRVSCISSFGRKPNEVMAPVRRESFGGRRFSVDVSRPGLSKAFKRDRVWNKMFFEMDVHIRKVGEDTRSFVHDLEGVQSLNRTVGKRIDNLLHSAADMRSSYRHIFKQQENTYVPSRKRGK